MTEQTLETEQQERRHPGLAAVLMDEAADPIVVTRMSLRDTTPGMNHADGYLKTLDGLHEVFQTLIRKRFPL